MAFKEFTAKAKSNVKIPMVSILKLGRMGLNGECYRKYFKDYKFVIFFYDEDIKKIGIKPTNEPKSNAFNIKVDKRGTLASINASTFLKYNNIPCDKSKSYTCYWNATDKILEVQL